MNRMTNPRKRTALAMAVTSLVAYKASALPAETESFYLSEIIVTATKKPQSLQDVSIAVSAFSATALVDSGVQGIKDIDGFIPNVRISSAGGVRNTPITIRGIVSDPNGPGIEQAVGVYVDGVYMGRPTTINSALYDLERIEVLRGPQGTLFGKNTVAGALNISTKLPTTEPQTEIAATYGNYNAFTLYGAVSGQLSDNVLARFSATRKERDGFLENSLGPDNQDEDATALRLTLVYEPTDALQMIFRADGARDRTQNGASQILVNGLATQLLGYSAPTNIGDRKIDDAPSAFQNRDVWGGSVEVNWELEAGTLTSITAVRGYEFSNDASLESSALDFGSSRISEKQVQYSQELRLTADVNDKLSYIAGLYFFKQDLDTNPQAFLNSAMDELFSVYAGMGLFNSQFGGLTVLDASSGPGQNINADLNDESYAAFGQATYQLNENLSVTAGLRYTLEKKAIKYYEFNQFFAEFLVDFTPLGGAISAFPVAPSIDDVSSSFDDDEVSGMLALNYNLNSDVLLYGSYSRGFKSGGFNAFNLVQPDGSIAQFQPENADSYELGFKSMLLNNRVRLNAAVFYLDYQDLQVNQLQSVEGGLPVFVTTNAASAKSSGVELEVLALLSEGLELQFAYGYNDSQYEDYTNATAAGDDFSNNHMQQSPAESTSAAMQYTLAVSNEWNLKSRAEIKYRGSYYKDPANTLELAQGGYSITNLRVGFVNESTGTELMLWGRNIFDKQYTTSKTFTDASIFPGHITGRLGNPRTYGIEMRMTF